MSIDLAALSPKELDALINQAKKRRTLLAKRKPLATVRSKLTQLARAEGYSIEELFGAGGARRGRAAKTAGPGKAAKPRKSGGKVAPKYRNPANPSETWTGRGKQPRWLAAQVKGGKKAEDFLIK